MKTAKAQAFFFSICLMVSVFFVIIPAAAGEVEILLEKLVEKGILSSKDAQEVLQEVKFESAKDRAKVINYTKKALLKDRNLSISEIPEWIQKTRFKGDLRLRYSFLNRKGISERHMGLYRLRLGFVTDITDTIQVGFGLASGGGKPRSTNQRMTDSFETPDIRLGYAYASYRPFPWIRLVGGKIKNPLWLSPMFLWDSDIRPEGVSVIIDYQLNPAIRLFCNTGFWILDEYEGEERDPVMVVFQPGYQLRLTDNIYSKTAGILYQFNNVKGNALKYSSESNTLTPVGGLKYNYDAYGITTELGFKTSFDVMPFFAVFADYLNNYTISSDDTAYLFGLTFGYQKVCRKSQWQFKPMYWRIERNAWLDVFPEGGAYSGQTNIKGFQILFMYGLLDHVRLGIGYHEMKQIDGRDLKDKLLDVDLIFDF